MTLAKISFRQRLIVSNLVLLLVVLPSLWFSLINAFEQQAVLYEKQTMQAYSFNLLAASEIEKGVLINQISLDGPEFDIPDSGLYAIIRTANNIVWHSASFIPPKLPITWQSSLLGAAKFNQVALDGQAHFNWQLKVAFEKNSSLYPFTFHIIKSKLAYDQHLSTFKQTLWGWLLAISIVFVTLQVTWMLWFQKPLQDLSEEIKSVEQGHVTQISDHYPIEISKLTANLNRLISTETQQRQRYKNTLADLAHSLKTPLAIILNSKGLPLSAQTELHKISNIINHQLKRAQTGQTSWHKGCLVLPIVEAIIEGLKKIHQQTKIQFMIDIADDAVFYGAQADAYEMIGNLLDNACKACSQQVAIKVFDEQGLLIQVTDDGKGLSESQTTAILARGYRADTYEQGHGIGLAVVRDLVDAYAGEFSINAHSELGGAQFTIMFKH